MADSGTAQEAQAMTESREKKPIPTQDAIRKLKAKLLPGFKYTLLFSLIIYLAMLIIGILAVKKCPVNENIPLFLCIIGFVGLASKLVTYLRDRIIPYFKIKYVESALYTTELVFFILGTYWVYKEYKPSFDPADGARYCQKTAYMYAFIYITAFFVVTLGVILLFVCLCCCAMCGVACLNSLIDDKADANESQVPYVDEEAKETVGQK
ncbi:hypothetical protein WA026_005881 [Henosepilachna vigintioctopunctata]|uniref:Uncharacterized protein n=1 Tax=Henosepilachna vigintioctopunctata TaxID=420089 RepID=A0AAW1U5C1_9CUCU